MKAITLYSRYERAWHWLQAISIIVLMATGVAIHFAIARGPLSLGFWLTVHEVAGVVTILNAAGALFHHVVGGTLRRFVPTTAEVSHGVIEQARYYLVGIFRNQPRPFPRTPESRLNPLQKLSYAIVLNVLLPLQALTGLWLWSMGTIRMVALLHTAGAWAMAAFFIGHIYMITTGPTVATYLREMLTGNE